MTGKPEVMPGQTVLMDVAGTVVEVEEQVPTDSLSLSGGA